MSRLSKLNVFANSPKSVKLFGSLVALLMVVSVGYGGYTLVSERFSSASERYGPWYYNSRGVKHDYGFAQSGRNYGSPGKLWAAFGGDQDIYTFAWRGPTTSLPRGQYLGCFFYRLMDIKHRATGEVNKEWTEKGKAELQIYNVRTARVKHRFTDTGVWAGVNTLRNWKLRRTCLAFYVGDRKQNVTLRAQLKAGNLYMEKTKITRITGDDKKFSNMKLLIPRDNRSWIIGGGF